MTHEERAEQIIYETWGDRTAEPDMQERIAQEIDAAVAEERESIAREEIDAHMVHSHLSPTNCVSCAILSGTAARIRARK